MSEIFEIIHISLFLPLSLSHSFTRSLVHSMSSPIFLLFDYCAPIFTDFTEQMKLKLKRLMNACERFIFNLRRDEHVSHFYCKLDWLTSDDRRILAAYSSHSSIREFISCQQPSFSQLRRCHTCLFA